MKTSSNILQLHINTLNKDSIDYLKLQKVYEEALKIESETELENLIIEFKQNNCKNKNKFVRMLDLLNNSNYFDFPDINVDYGFQYSYAWIDAIDIKLYNHSKRPKLKVFGIDTERYLKIKISFELEDFLKKRKAGIFVIFYLLEEGDCGGGCDTINVEATLMSFSLDNIPKKIKTLFLEDIKAIERIVDKIYEKISD